MRLVMVGLVCAFLVCVRLPAAVEVSTTQDGVRFGWLGKKPSTPAPTVFFFGGAIEDSLTQPQYMEGINTLGPSVLAVTVDLPGHGAEHRAGEPPSLRAWRYRLDHDEDFTVDLVRRATAVLNHLVNQRWTDPAKVAVFGTSRGGFMAFHFAAAEPRVGSIAAFAPLTDLLIPREFFEMPNDHRARAIAAARLADRLYDRRIWIIIGSTDYRVSTERAIQFTQRVVEAAAARGRRPGIELHVEPTDGHRVPDGCYAVAAHWLLKQWGAAK